jgi:transcriptional regulator with XRE-family HTH domain
MSVSEQIRQAVEGCHSYYVAAKGSGVGQSSLNRFMRRERSLSMDSIDKLAEFFGMQLTPPKRRPAAKKQ